MTVQPIEINEIKLAEVIAEGVLINKIQDGLDLLADLYYQGYDGIIIYAKNITPDFFELKTGIAGEILQKFSNYRMKLAIIGEFSKYSSKSLNDFIFESNKAGHTVFVSSIEEAKKQLSKS